MRKVWYWLSIPAVAMLLQPPFSTAQTAEEMQQLRKEIEGVKKGQESIQKELQEIKKLLKQGLAAQQKPQQKPFAPLDISVAGDPVKGNKDARLAILEFSDFE